MPLITITDSFGNSGIEVANVVAEDLGVEVFDDKRLQAIVTDMGGSSRSGVDVDRQPPGFWERVLSREPQVYLDTIEAAVYDIARRGDGVIIGHGSQMLLRDFECAFHVRLISDFSVRVDNLMIGQGMDQFTATNLVANSDIHQRGNFHYAYQLDLDTPSLYDLIINTGKMKTGTIANLIVHAVRSDDIRSCDLDALSSMRRLSLQRRIQAELLENNIDVSTLNISLPQIGTANITGVAASLDEKNRIPEIVEKVQGISQVSADLSVWVYSL